MTRFVILPRTYLGRWSAGLFASGIVCFLLLQLSVAAGQRGGDDLLDNLWLTIPALAAAATVLMAGVVGSVAVFRRRERAALVFVAMIVAALLTVFLLGELVLPH